MKYRLVVFHHSRRSFSIGFPNICHDLISTVHLNKTFIHFEWMSVNKPITKQTTVIFCKRMRIQSPSHVFFFYLSSSHKKSSRCEFGIHMSSVSSLCKGSKQTSAFYYVLKGVSQIIFHSGIILMSRDYFDNWKDKQKKN